MVLPRANLKQVALAPTSGQIAQSQRTPASVGGWNVYDSIASMDPEYALILDNMIPTTTECVVRPGYTSWATGMSGQVETLFQWGGPSTTKMLAANGGKIYDVSTAGAVGAALGTGYANNRWQWVNFGTSGGEFIFACNGADTPWNYNGTVIATIPAITGITAANIINVAAFQNRLFFVMKNSLTFAYLPIASIGGAALTFDLSSLFPMGGYLISIGTWSRAGLTQQADLCVFLTSMGEFAVYSGTDPGNANAWALQNRGRVGSPVGYRCMDKIGSDLFIINQDGLIALSQVLWLDRVDTTKTLSTKIGSAITSAVSQYSTNFGWQIFQYPKGNLAIVNVPLAEGSQIQQYVASTITGSWCRFRNINANCWVLFNDKPYFGGIDGKVYQWDSGNNDNGANIEWEARSAFVDMGTPGENKHWVFVRPIFAADGSVAINLAVEVDYQLTIPQGVPATSPSTSQWDSAVWDSAPWADSTLVQTAWAGANVVGRVCAVHMRGATMNQTVAWLATDYTFTSAGLI